MFNEIKELVAQLDELEQGIKDKKYKACKEARKTLQEVKKQAQDLRVKIIEGFKAKED